MGKEEPVIGIYEHVSIYCPVCGLMEVDEEHKNYCPSKGRDNIIDRLARRFGEAINK